MLDHQRKFTIILIVSVLGPHHIILRGYFLAYFGAQGKHICDLDCLIWKNLLSSLTGFSDYNCSHLCLS